MTAASEVRIRTSREWLRTLGSRRAGWPRRIMGSLCGSETLDDVVNREVRGTTNENTLITANELKDELD